MKVDREGRPLVQPNLPLELSESRDAHRPRRPLRAIEHFWGNLRPKLEALPMNVDELDERISDLADAPATQRIETVGAIKRELEIELAQRQKDIDAQKAGCCGGPSPELIEAQKRVTAARPLVGRLQNVIMEETLAGIPATKPPQT
jgi:hypothetical protein